VGVLEANKGGGCPGDLCNLGAGAFGGKFWALCFVPRSLNVMSLMSLTKHGILFYASMRFVSDI
jgi:hypothetical protein